MNGSRSILIGLCLVALVAQAPLRGEPERDHSLLTATLAGRASDVEAALKKGADPNQSWGPGLTALALALGLKDTAKASLLRKAGAREPDCMGSSSSRSGEGTWRAPAGPSSAARIPTRATVSLALR